MGNIYSFVLAVADHAVFWVGLALMIEPYFDGFNWSVWKRIKERHLTNPATRKRIFRMVGIICIGIGVFQAWNDEHTFGLHPVPMTPSLV